MRILVGDEGSALVHIATVLGEDCSSLLSAESDTVESMIEDQHLIGICSSQCVCEGQCGLQTADGNDDIDLGLDGSLVPHQR